jgi:hypothetical protein
MDRGGSRHYGMTYHRLLTALATEPVQLPRTDDPTPAPADQQAETQ